MEERGTVSVWLGKSASRGAFERATEVAFSEDGDFLGSAFSRAFGIGYHDAGLMEAEFSEDPPRSLASLLDGISYGDKVLPRLLASGASLRGDENCFVLLYDERHEQPAAWVSDGVELRFVAAVRYM